MGDDMVNTIIEAKDIGYRYPNGPRALKGVNFSINKGEKVALIGPNGAGKSTILLMFNGMLRPDSGAILFNGKEIEYEKKTLREIRRRVGFVFQDPDRQIISPTVWQDVAFGPVNLGMSNDEVKSAVSNAIYEVGLENFDRRPPHQLSGGEKKRVAIAGVLAMDPEVLIIDEPTSGLDPAGSEDLMELLTELNNQGKTIIISSHDVELVYPWADRIIIMQNGDVLADAEPDDAFKNRDLIRRARLSPPVLVELHQELEEQGMITNGRFPKTVLDMIRFIDENRHNDHCSEQDGCIYLFNIDDPANIPAEQLIADKKITTVGAMGSRAKITAGKTGIHVQYTYGVVDKCLLRAVNGKDTLIITTGAMIERVYDRINTFNKEAGKNIRIIPAGES